jgi:predicted Fe-S protein YdhL (DUF1289 family)
MVESDEVASPCINVCVLGLDNICLGCFRSLEEIGAWGNAGNEERRRIVNAARHRETDSKND